MKWTTWKNPKKKKNIRQNEICRGKPRHEGAEKVDTLRQNQDFDEVTRCINSMVKHFALQSQLRCPRFFGVQSIHRHKCLETLCLSSSEVNSACGFHLGNLTLQEMRAAIYG